MPCSFCYVPLHLKDSKPILSTVINIIIIIIMPTILTAEQSSIQV